MFPDLRYTLNAGRQANGKNDVYITKKKKNANWQDTI